MSRTKFLLLNFLAVPVSLFLGYAFSSDGTAFFALADIFYLVPVITIGGPLLVGKKIFTVREFISFILMLYACLISFSDFIILEQKLGITKGSYNSLKSFSVKPRVLSVCFAIFLYVSLIVKGFIDFPKKVYSYSMMVSGVVFLSSFMNLFVSNDKWKIFGFIELPFSAQTLAILVILFSYFGVKAAVGFGWIALLICAVSRMADADSAMGLLAIPYLLCPFTSLMIAAQDTEKFKNMSGYVAETVKKVLDHAGSDVSASVDVTKKAVKAVAGAAAGIPPVPLGKEGDPAVPDIPPVPLVTVASDSLQEENNAEEAPEVPVAGAVVEIAEEKMQVLPRE